jgi:hypothetical protein
MALKYTLIKHLIKQYPLFHFDAKATRTHICVIL